MARYYQFFDTSTKLFGAQEIGQFTLPYAGSVSLTGTTAAVFQITNTGTIGGAAKFGVSNGNSIQPTLWLEHANPLAPVLFANGMMRLRRFSVDLTAGGGAGYTTTGQETIIGVTAIPLGGGTINLTNPDSSHHGVIVIIKDEVGQAQTRTITINRTGSALIHGATSVTITTFRGVLALYWNGTNWERLFQS